MKNRFDHGIVWLASYPKSGNTWVRMFLASYRAHGLKISPDSIPVEFTVTDTRDRDYHAVSPYPVEKLATLEVLMIRGAAMLHAMASVSERPVFFKTHGSNAVLDGHRLFHPKLTVGAIYVVRDPRDVAVSFARWTGGEIDHVIDLMAAKDVMLEGINVPSIFSYLSDWSQHVRSWIDDEEIAPLLVRYEDMLSSPRATFSKIAVAAGYPVDDDVLAMAIGNTSFDTLREMEETHGFREAVSTTDARFFRNGEAGAWKEFLTSEQSARIVNIHGSMMERLGYDLS